MPMNKVKITVLKTTLDRELAAEYGVKTVAGSDAHRPEDVWGNIEDAFAIAEKFGLEIRNAEVARKILAQC